MNPPHLFHLKSHPKTRWQELDEDMAYDVDALDRVLQTTAHGYD